MQIEISISEQKLYLSDVSQNVIMYSVSTAKNGPGEQNGSECTPRGEHVICEKIGDGAVSNTVFVGRVATGEIYSPSMRETFPDRDWILTRILWLDGCEPGRNQGENETGCCDTKARYIYIHGSPDDVEMGKPGSHGCIRMRNADMIDLFDRVTVHTRVTIR